MCEYAGVGGSLIFCGVWVWYVFRGDGTMSAIGHTVVCASACMRVCSCTHAPVTCVPFFHLHPDSHLHAGVYMTIAFYAFYVQYFSSFNHALFKLKFVVYIFCICNFVIF